MDKKLNDNSLSNVAEMAIARRKHFATLIVKDDANSTVSFSGVPWDMSLTAVDSPEKLLKAIYYLTEKSWFTKDHLKALLLFWQRTFGNGFDLTMFNAYPC